MATASSDLVISNFKVGIGPSPHMGFGDMRNLDTTTRPGIARLNYGAVKKSGTAIADLPNKIVRNPLDSSEFFSVDDSGIVYVSNDMGETWQVLTGAPTDGKGIEVWQDFLMLVATPGSIAQLYAFGPLTTGPTATWNNMGTLRNAVEFAPMITSINDGKLYGGSGDRVYSLDKGHATGVFSPTGGSTGFTLTTNALDLPGSDSNIGVYRIKCLEELGNNLMIGTDKAPANSVDRKVDKDGVVFPWDRTSVSFDTPMVLKENGINQMLNYDQSLYIQAGLNAKWFKSNGVQYVPAVSLPNYLVNLDAGRFLRNQPNAITQYRQKVFFGNAVGATATDIGGIGVWSLDPRTGTLNFEHQISTGNMGDNSAVRIGALLPFSEERLMIGWKDGATAGIDVTGTARYENYQGYLDSPFYQVGTPLIKKEFSQLEFQLVEPLATGQGVRISYRTDLSATYTVIGTYDFTLLGSVSSHNAIANIPACEFVQLRVALTTPAATNASPQLRTVTLR